MEQDQHNPSQLSAAPQVAQHPGFLYVYPLPFHLLGGLLIGAFAVYGFLAWSESSAADVQAQTAAVAAVPEAFAAVQLAAHGSFVVDLSSNQILHAHNADVQLPLASITKIALVLAVSPVISADHIVTISARAVERGEGSDLRAGDSWRANDLMEYTLVASSNTGAEALAEAAEEKLRALYLDAPETDVTVWRMNMLAKELGLRKTYFLNASGLDMSPTQPSAMGSARDATILLAYAYKTVPHLFSKTSGTVLTVGPIDGPKIDAENTNEALNQIPGLVMGKTGFTDLAGGNLTVVFMVGNRPIVATVLGSTLHGRFDDMLTLVSAAREKYSKSGTGIQ